MRWARLMWWQDFDFRPKYVEKRNIYCYPTYLWTSDSKRDGTIEEKNREKSPSPVPYRLTTSPFIPSQCLALQIDTGSSVTSRLRLITGFDLGCHHHEGLLNVGWVLGRGLDKLNAERISEFLSHHIIIYHIIHLFTYFVICSSVFAFIYWFIFLLFLSFKIDKLIINISLPYLLLKLCNI